MFSHQIRDACVCIRIDRIDVKGLKLTVHTNRLTRDVRLWLKQRMRARIGTVGVRIMPQWSNLKVER